MEQTMRRNWMRLAAAVLAITLAVPTGWAVRTNSDGEVMIRVGLASSYQYVETGELEAAHLQNNTGYGAGFRFGYYDGNMDFVELGRTEKDIDQVAVLKTQNLYYGRDASLGKTTYSSSITSNIAVGCYHILIDSGYGDYEDARRDAEDYEDGFVAWIDEEYQVRVGAYLSKGEALDAIDTLGEGTVVGTTSYGMSIVETGTDHILFQFDQGTGGILAILPDVTGAEDVRTWFSNYKYRGGFLYQRLNGGNISVVNVVELEDYVKGVVCYEMGRTWPLEALKAQATCARTYVLRNMGRHQSYGFDVCGSTECQAYHGCGDGRSNSGPSEVSDQAVEETAGQVVLYNGKLAETVYSSSAGGATEDAKNVWGTDTVNTHPYLKGVIDPYESLVDDLNPYSPWTVTYTSEELTSKLQSNGFGVGTSIDYLELTYSEMGNVIRLQVHWKNGNSNTFKPSASSGGIDMGIRGNFGVKSIRFTVNGKMASQPGGNGSGSYAVNGSGTLSGTDDVYVISGTGSVSGAGSDLYVISGSGKISSLAEGNTGASGTNVGGGTVTVSGDTYVFDGAGWGHQLGMSQFGANAMAREGFDYDEILKFYFPGVQVDAY